MHREIKKCLKIFLYTSDEVDMNVGNLDFLASSVMLSWSGARLEENAMKVEVSGRTLCH